MRFFEAVVDIRCVRDEWTSYTLVKMKMTHELLALQLDPNGRDGDGGWRIDVGMEEKEGGSDAERRK